MGEQHQTPHTHMWQQAVLQETINRGLRPAYGMEFSHLSFQENMRVLGFDIEADSIERVLNQDPHNIVLRQLALILTDDQAHTQYLQFCEEHNISLSFNDAARMESGDDAYLDYDDALTRARALKHDYSVSEEDLEQKPDDEISACDMGILDHGGHHVISPTGFHIRNDVMVHNGLQQWRIQKPDVLVMGTGLIHVFGAVHNSHDFVSPYEHSMTAILRHKTAAVIPCVFDHEAFTFPKDTDDTARITLQGFSKEAYAIDTDDRAAVDAATKRVCQESGDLVDYYPCLSTEDRKSYFERLGDVIDIAFAAHQNNQTDKCPDTSSAWVKKAGVPCRPQ